MPGRLVGGRILRRETPADDPTEAWLAASLGLLALVVVMLWLCFWYVPAYVIVGAAIWLATFESGVHATVAGVALGCWPRPGLWRHASRPTA